MPYASTHLCTIRFLEIVSVRYALLISVRSCFPRDCQACGTRSYSSLYDPVFLEIVRRAVRTIMDAAAGQGRCCGSGCPAVSRKRHEVLVVGKLLGDGERQTIMLWGRRLRSERGRATGLAGTAPLRCSWRWQDCRCKSWGYTFLRGQKHEELHHGAHFIMETPPPPPLPKKAHVITNEELRRLGCYTCTNSNNQCRFFSIFFFFYTYCDNFVNCYIKCILCSYLIKYHDILLCFFIFKCKCLNNIILLVIVFK